MSAPKVGRTVALVATVPMAVFIDYTASAGSPYKTGGPIVVLGAALLISVLVGAYWHRQGQQWALARAWVATVAILTLLALAYNGMALLQPTVCHPWSTDSVCDQFRAGR
jgi:hypothetical protein